MKEKKEIRAVFFDIDGTSYQHNIHDVPFSTYEALEQMKKKGIKLGACTSRVNAEMVHLPKRFTSLLDGIITCAGAMIEADGKNIQTHYVPFEDAKRIQQYCKEQKIVLRWATAENDCCIDHWDDEEKMKIFGIYFFCSLQAIHWKKYIKVKM